MSRSKKNKRPRVEVEKEMSDWIIEGLGWVGLFFLILLPIIYYSDLPEIIPSHYGANGEPDAYSGKAVIWTLPIVGIVLFAGMNVLFRVPHLYNYTVEITEENAASQYLKGTRLMRTMNTVITCAFAYLTFVTIKTAMGEMGGLGPYFLFIFLGLIFGSIGMYIFTNYWSQSSED